MRKARTSKLLDLKQAVGLVKEGSSLAIGGVSLMCKPAAFIREIVRKRIGNLTLFTNIASYDVDLLIGAGLVKKTYVPHVSFEYLGMAPNFRKAAEGGEIETMESDVSLLQGGYMATIEGLKYHPVPALRGTDLIKATDLLKKYTAPDGEEMFAVRALSPDVAVIHVAQADEYGNARHLTAPFFDLFIARASKKVIITADEIIGVRMTEEDPFRTTIASYFVDAVVETPFGAHPCSSPPLYAQDEEHLREYLGCAELTRKGENPAAFPDYLRKYIYHPDSIYDYLELIGGLSKLTKLRKETQG